MYSEKAKKHADACRFCYMCRHLCPVELATGKENNTPRAKGLQVSMMERGMKMDSGSAVTMYECLLCRAKVCTALRQFHINPEFCIGCGKCAKNCPAGAISGKIKSPYHINNDVCIKCGSCKDNCNFDAIYVEM